MSNSNDKIIDVNGNVYANTLAINNVIRFSDGTTQNTASSSTPVGIPYVTFFGATGNGTTNDANAFVNACANSTGFCVPPGTYLIATTVNITKPMVMQPGAIILVAAGITLTVSSSLDADLWKIFDGPGSVKFAGGSVNKVYPQWWGAISNNNTTTFANDCTPAFQKAIDSNAAVYVPSGYYYISSTVVLSIETLIEFEGGYVTTGNTTPGGPEPFYDNRAVVYSDQDIWFFEVRTGRTTISGGVFNAVSIPNHTKGIFRLVPRGARRSSGAWNGNMHLTKIINVSVIGYLIGNRPTTLPVAGQGSIGIYVDWDEVYGLSTTPNILNCVFSGYFESVKSVFFDPGPTYSFSYAAGQWNTFDFVCERVKQIIQLSELHSNELQLTGNGRDNVYEVGMPGIVFKTGRNVVDTTLSDNFGVSGDTFDDYVGNFYFTKSPNYRPDSTVWTNMHGLVPDRGFFGLTNAPGWLFNGKGAGLNKISSTANILTGIHNRYPTSIGFYKKPSGISSFSELIKPSTATDAGLGLPATVSTDITTSSAYLYNMFNTVATPTSLAWNANAMDSDYVEIYISGLGGIGLTEFYMYLTATSNSAAGIKQYQILTLSSSGAVINNHVWDCKASNADFYNGNGLFNQQLNSGTSAYSIIIRLIGSYSSSEAVTVRDIACFLANEIVKPSVDTAGGRLTGPLTAIGLVQTTKTGTITTSTASSTVTGTNTLFLTEVSVGSLLYDTTGAYVGQVSTIANNTSLTLSSNSILNLTNAVYQSQHRPPDVAIGDGSWDSPGLLRLGNSWLWVDASGRLRIKNSAIRPTSDTDGIIVGTQS